MAQPSSGKALREARERKGYDLNTVARRLRIRPDILRAIEAGDFAAMPPRGYTRNMVNAYAKLLGLNPTEIVNLYLDEAYAQQVERARGTGPSSGFNMQRETRRSRSQLGVGENSGAETRAIHPVGTTSDGGTRQFTRVLYDDGTPFSRDDYGVTRERTARPGKSDRDFSSHHSGYDSTTHGFGSRTAPQRGNRNIYAGQTPMHYSASRLPGFLQSKTALIALGVAIVAIVIVVLVVFIGGRNNAPKEDVSTLPVSGITDTTGGESSASAATEIAPTSARVVYSVKSGDECYVEVYNDGAMSAENLTGPTEKTVDVTGKFTITTWSPELLKVTVDGQNVELKTSNEYGGMYAYTVDFATILKQWQATHGSGGSAAAAAAAGAVAGGAAAVAATTNAGGTSTTNGQNTGTTAQGQGTQDDGTNYDETADRQFQTQVAGDQQPEEEVTEEEQVPEPEEEEVYYEEVPEETQGEQQQ